ncbi:LysR family transcriptional regulator [Vibrio mexicanus]|uniref:LysR family transcriptional regulator n=1 Tax=Vibrio mexicanus TaxID=1004326 RepID=UPI00063CEA61|nr:LysR family transcriptional regulator [Vibrio mexicanus]
MKKRKIDIDLNLLRIVLIMCEMKSLKAVGRKFNRSESAISKSLAKASEELGQTLFVRTAEGLVPTHYTKSIYPQLKSALIHVENALDLESFDPKQHTHPIHIAMLAQPMQKYGARILAKLNQLFPNTQIELSIWNNSSPEKIINNDIQLGVYAFNEALPSNIYQRPIINDELTLVVSQKHRDATWETVKNWSFIMTRTPSWNDDQFKIQALLAQQDIKISAPFVVDDINICIDLLQQGEFAAAYSQHCILDSMQEVLLPSFARLPIKLTCCMNLSDRDAPLQKLLLDTVLTIMKEKSSLNEDKP